MQYFLETVETIDDGLGFQHFDSTHLVWLAAFVVVTVLCCFWYRKLDAAEKDRWKKVVAILLVADELFKLAILFIGGNYEWDYLPLHLCSINIFLIVYHAWKPSELLGQFLYTICIPGALAALLFPSWAALPATNGMHIHSFTIHILLAMYPIVLTAAGEIKPQIKRIPRCMLLLVCMAAVVLGVNLLLDTNFMFLMYAEQSNPLLWFEKNWGNHLLGFPVIIAAVLAVMNLPWLIFQKRKRK